MTQTQDISARESGHLTSVMGLDSSGQPAMTNRYYGAVDHRTVSHANIAKAGMYLVTSSEGLPPGAKSYGMLTVYARDSSGSWMHIYFDPIGHTVYMRAFTESSMTGTWYMTAMTACPTT